MQMSPSGLCLTYLEADRVISTFSFDPNLEPSPQNPHCREAIGPPESLPGTAQASAGRWVKEMWNAKQGPCLPHHKRWIRIPLEHAR